MRTTQYNFGDEYFTFYNPNIMRYFALFVFSLLAHTERSFAKDYASNRTVNIYLITNYYMKSVHELPIPSLEYEDKSAAPFEKKHTEAIRYYGISLMNNVHNQAKIVGEQFIEDIENAIDRFRKSLNLVIHNGKRNCLDEALKRINYHLYKFLELKPENIQYNLPDLPPLPEQKVQIVSRTVKRTPKELFLNFVETADDVSLQMYAYINELYLHGWRYARRAFEIIRIQMYTEILNGPVMSAYRKAVDEIDEHSDLVQCNVSPKTWKSFRSAADHIVAISHNK